MLDNLGEVVADVTSECASLARWGRSNRPSNQQSAISPCPFYKACRPQRPLDLLCHCFVPSYQTWCSAWTSLNSAPAASNDHHQTSCPRRTLINTDWPSCRRFSFQFPPDLMPSTDVEYNWRAVNATEGAVCIGASMPVGKYVAQYPAAMQYGEQAGAGVPAPDRSMQYALVVDWL